MRLSVFFACALVVAASSLASQSWQFATRALAAESEVPFLQLPAFDLTPTQGEYPKELQVGDTVEFVVKGEWGGEPPFTLLAPPNAETLFDLGWDVRVVRRKESDPKVLEVKVSPLKPGELNLPALAIVDSVQKNVARTHPLKIKVTSTLDPQDPKSKEANPLVPVAVAFPRWILATIVVLLVLAGAGIGYGFYRRQQAKKRALRKKPARRVLPEDEHALEELKKIEIAGYLKKNLPKKHFFGVSEELKRYLGARFGFDALEKTTSELLRELETRQAMGPDLRRQLQEVFEKLDLFKFTDQVPTESDAQNVLATARQLISVTKRPAPARSPDAV